MSRGPYLQENTRVIDIQCPGEVQKVLDNHENNADNKLLRYYDDDIQY